MNLVENNLRIVIYTSNHHSRILTGRIFLIIILMLLSGALFSQNSSAIKLEDIPQKGIRKYITEMEIDHMNDFSQIMASCKKETIEPGFGFIQDVFDFDYNVNDVWECYRGIDPLKTWNKKSLRYGLMLSKDENSATYISNKNPVSVKTGQVYFLNLRILGGLVKIPVAFEIINIDPVRKIAEYSYINNSKAEGKHILEFSDSGEGHTRIIHRSYYKSSSDFRDTYLYPVFHRKFVREFHINMRETLENEMLLKRKNVL